MQFDSVLFFILFPIAVFAYYIIPKRFRYVWLLAVSYAFYVSLAGKAVFVLILSTAVTYFLGLILQEAEEARAKKAILSAGVTVLAGTLFIFKYLDFSLALSGSGLRFNLILPLGISFYIFQSISYIADVYKKKIKAEKNPLKLALFTSFFLSIVSGPINRAPDMLGQFECNSDLSYDAAKRGLQKMLWGYFLKIAVAGRLVIAVDNVYADADAYPGFVIAFAALAYLFMLYCDFEGYSQIVTGAACILGIKMKENFRQPFYSSGMGELWRRWHISLSTWLRDYIYIPLGGNRRGTVRKYINIFVVLFISGIWHGANLTFIIWGAINGFFIIAGQILLPYRDRVASVLKEKICKNEKQENTFESVRTFFKRIGVYILSAYTFIYFANSDVLSAYKAVKGILTRFSLSDISAVTTLGLGRFNLAVTLVMVLFVLVFDGMADKRSCDTPSVAAALPTPVRWALYYALVCAILMSMNLGGKEFIYSNM